MQRTPLRFDLASRRVISRDIMQLRSCIENCKLVVHVDRGVLAFHQEIICMHIYLHMRASYVQRTRMIVRPLLSRSNHIYWKEWENWAYMPLRQCDMRPLNMSREDSCPIYACICSA